MRRVALVFLLLVSAEACAAQSHYRPSTPWLVADAEPPRWYEMRPGELYRPAWEYAKACSGFKEQPGGRYEDVHWLVVSPGGLRNEKGQRIIGVWLTPDTVVVDSAWTEALWLIAHELVHHLKQVSGEKNAHPFRPFAFPCMLMYYQNVAGGIMAGNTSPAASGSPMPPLHGRIPLKFIGEAIRREEGEP